MRPACAIESCRAECGKPVTSVVGPVHLDGSEHAMTVRCRRFANQLHGRYGLPVALVDERLRPAEAEERLAEAGCTAGASRSPSWIPRPPDHPCPVLGAPDMQLPRPISSLPRCRVHASPRQPDTRLVGIHTGGVCWPSACIAPPSRSVRTPWAASVELHVTTTSAKGLHPQPQGSRILLRRGRQPHRHRRRRALHRPHHPRRPNELFRLTAGRHGSTWRYWWIGGRSQTAHRRQLLQF